MSRTARKASATPDGDRDPPNVGALLRTTYQIIRERQFAVLLKRGFGDLNQPLLNVFLYPGPDRARPSELAERINMTRQAMNYLLGQLEELGYIERRLDAGTGHRLVFLTTRGWKVRETILGAVKEVEAEWSSALGRQRFRDFLTTLQQLSPIGGTAGLPALPRRGRAAPRPRR